MVKHLVVGEDTEDLDLRKPRVERVRNSPLGESNCGNIGVQLPSAPQRLIDCALNNHGRVAQMVECSPEKRKVAGLSPAPYHEALEDCQVVWFTGLTPAV